MSSAKSGRRPPPSLRSGRVNQKLRTRNLLLATAATLIAQGQTPGVAEVADMAKVSRRTAWRYFPTREKLLADATLEGLRSMMEAEIGSVPAGSDPASVELRLRAAVESIMRRAFENEGLLRTMVHTTVLEPPRRMPKRGIRRVQWIEDAIAPLKTQLAPAAWKRLVTGLTVCVGIEAMLVLRDIHGMTPAQAIHVCQWMSVAMVREAMADRRPAASASGRTRKRGGKSER